MKLDKQVGRGLEYLFKHPKTKIYYYRRYTKATGEISKSLKTTDLAEAKKKRDDFLAGGRARVRTRTFLFALEQFDLWLERKESLGASSNTITSIKASRKHFAPYFETMDPADITAEWWESVFIPETKKRTGNPKRRFFNDRKWLIAFLRQLKDDGSLAAIPTIRKVDQPTKVGKIYSDEEVESMLNFAQNEDLRLAILMAFTMGMRRGEIFQLSTDRIDLKAKTITLRAEDTKTKRHRSFAISDDCWPLIKARCYVGARWVFPNRDNPSRPLHKDGFKTAWTNLKQVVGVTGRFHDLRHTFLTKAFKAPGVNPALICYYAGLSMEVAERVYLHFTAEDTRKMTKLVSVSGSLPESEH